MKVLWLSVNTTSLDPQVANIVEISAALQVDGVVKSRLHARVIPILHSEDQHWGGTPEQFLAAYNGSTNDPQFRLSMFPEGPFFYSADTLRHLDVEDPGELLDAQRLPKQTLNRLLDELGPTQPRRWILAGHNAATYLAPALLAWAKRVDKSLALRLQELVDFDKPIDTISFFRVVAAFQPPVAAKGFGLKQVAAYFGKDTNLGTESKLEGLLSVCGNVISGGVNEKAAHPGLPS